MNTNDLVIDLEDILAQVKQQFCHLHKMLDDIYLIKETLTETIDDIKHKGVSTHNNGDTMHPIARKIKDAGLMGYDVVEEGECSYVLEKNGCDIIAWDEVDEDGDTIVGIKDKAKLTDEDKLAINIFFIEVQELKNNERKV